MRYLVFVVFLVLVIVFAHATHRGAGERLGERLVLAAATALQLDTNGVSKDPRFQTVSFEVSHLDIILAGKVATAGTRDELLKLIREGTPVGRLRDEGLMLEQAREPELSAVMTKGRVTLAGRVPAEELALRLRRAFPGQFVDSQLTVDKGVNVEDWLSRSDAVLARFFQVAKEGEFSLKDGVLRLQGSVENPLDVDLIKSELESWLPGDRYRLEAEGLKVAAAARPVELAMRKVEGRWVIHGLLPDRPALDAIVHVVEEMDAPATVDAAAVTVDPSLTRPRWLQDGRLERFLKVFVSTVRGNPEILIRRGGVVLRGSAIDFIAKSNLPSFAGETFGYGVEVDLEGLVLASGDQANRDKWLRFDLSPGEVVISGTVPSEEAKRDLAGSLARAFPGAIVKDSELGVDTAVPAMPWLLPLGGFFADLGELTVEKGTLDLAGRRAFLGGVARTHWSRNALVGKLEQVLGPDFQISDYLLVDPRGEDGPAEAIKVYFGLGSREVGKDQEPKIAEAAGRLRQAGEGTNILALIKGYASPGGAVDYNLKLSEDRALAVYQALIGRQVNPKVLKILPQGVDPHLTDEEARRVEIFVR